MTGSGTLDKVWALASQLPSFPASHLPTFYLLSPVF
jgi:hypothetical protein